MHETASPKTASDYLYPPIAPFDQRMMGVSGGHRIYVERCGNPRGVPVIVVHGGPGGGCSPSMRRFFDPEFYHIILFDQRGCGRSRPHASVVNNTTWDLVADIEHIRRVLRLGKVMLFGGSWGATLALVHAQTHPQAVSALILRGVFLATRDELDWFYRGGAARFWPDEWQRFLAPLPPSERDDPIAAYHRRLFSGDPRTEIEAAQAWTARENALATLAGEGGRGTGPAEYVRAFARLENHYFINDAFLSADDRILNRLDRLRGIPGVIVQGRYDMICPPATAHALAAGWPDARLQMVPAAGHALSEPGITARLVAETNRLKAVLRR